MPAMFRYLALAAVVACSRDGEAPAPGPTVGGSKVPNFVDAAAASGLEFAHTNGAAGQYFMIETMGAGAAFVDYDGDGYLDVYLVDGFSVATMGEEFRPVNLLEESPSYYFINQGDQIDRPRHAEGDIDSLVYRIRQSGPTPQGNRLYRNEERGDRFSDVTDVTGGGDTGYGMGCAVGDFDNDGDADIYVANYGPNALYRNEPAAMPGASTGRGSAISLRDATAEAAVGDPSWGAGAAFFDADNDGQLDLYAVNYVDFHVGNNRICGVEDASTESAEGTLIRVRKDRRSYCSPDRYRGAPDRFYHNAGGRFEDVTRRAGLFSSEGKGLGVVTTDYDGDGDTDLYVANDGVRNFLYRNDGEGRFVDVALTAGVAYNRDGRPEAGMGVDWGDYDGDTDFDLFVTNYSKQTNTLYRNGGAGRFTDVTHAAQLGEVSYNPLGFGTFFFEADNDGDLDLFVANGHVHDKVQYIAGNAGISYEQPNQLFANDGGGFVDISAAAGPGLTPSFVSRGSAYGDYDSDGDLDILVTNCNGPAQLLRNDLPVHRNWLSVRLVGTEVNRDAVGSRIAVTCDGRTQVREVRTSGSYASASDIRQHFGLGDCNAVESLEIIWHDGSLQVMDPGTVRINEFLTIRQGES